jgi:hypothetical protein
MIPLSTASSVHVLVSRVEPCPKQHVAPATWTPVPPEQATVHTQHVLLTVRHLATALAYRVTEDRVTAARALARQVNVSERVGVIEDDRVRDAVEDHRLVPRMTAQ